MTNFVITSTTMNAQTLLDGETGYIARDGELVVSDADAVTASGSSQMAILGNITTFGNFEAIDFDGSDIDVFIGEVGSVIAVSNSGLELTATTRIEDCQSGLGSL